MISTCAVQAPHFNWRDVVVQLDHTGFMVVNKKGLRLLVQGLIRGLQEVFPVEYVYRQWKNTEGQVQYQAKHNIMIDFVVIFVIVGIQGQRSVPTKICCGGIHVAST